MVEKGKLVLKDTAKPKEKTRGYPKGQERKVHPQGPSKVLHIPWEFREEWDHKTQMKKLTQKLGLDSNMPGLFFLKPILLYLFLEYRTVTDLERTPGSALGLGM